MEKKKTDHVTPLLSVLLPSLQIKPKFMQEAKLSLLACPVICLSSNPGVLSVFTLFSLAYFLPAPRIRDTLTPESFHRLHLVWVSTLHICVLIACLPSHLRFSVRLDLNSPLVQQLQAAPFCSSSVISLYRTYFFKYATSLPD